jgi:hypothetical protein
MSGTLPGSGGPWECCDFSQMRAIYVTWGGRKHDPNQTAQLAHTRFGSLGTGPLARRRDCPRRHAGGRSRRPRRWHGQPTVGARSSTWLTSCRGSPMESARARLASCSLPPGARKRWRKNRAWRASNPRREPATGRQSCARTGTCRTADGHTQTARWKSERPIG